MKIELPIIYSEQYRARDEILTSGVRVTSGASITRFAVETFDVAELAAGSAPVVASWTELPLMHYQFPREWVIRKAESEFIAPLSVVSLQHGVRQDRVLAGHLTGLIPRSETVAADLAGMMPRSFRTDALADWFRDRCVNPSVNVTPPRGMEFVDGTLESEREAVARMAARLAFVNGELWCAVSEPVLELIPGWRQDGERFPSLTVEARRRRFSGKQPGNCFPQDLITYPLSMKGDLEKLVVDGGIGEPRRRFENLVVSDPSAFSTDAASKAAGDFARAAVWKVVSSVGALDADAVRAYLDVRDLARADGPESLDFGRTVVAVGALGEALPDGEAKRLIEEGVAFVRLAFPERPNSATPGEAAP